jgi:hypothetical protein
VAVLHWNDHLELDVGYWNSLGSERVELIFARRRRLHELDGCAVGIANINDPLSSIGAAFERLWFAYCFPTGRSDRVQHRIKIVDKQGNVHRSDIARPKTDMFPVRRGEILEQLDFVPVTF